MGYFDHIHSKSTHERRQHATRVAGGIVAVMFLVWVTTLGVRLASPTTSEVAGSDNQSQLANVAGMYAGENTLQVATS